MPDDVGQSSTGREDEILKRFDLQLKVRQMERKKRFQALSLKLRGWHRDLGCLALGLTVVYALSGLALNHMGDINTTQRLVEREWTFISEKPKATPFELASMLQRAAEIEEIPSSVYPVEPRELAMIGELEVSWPGGRTMIYNTETHRVLERWNEAIPIIGPMNWLHRARGKAGWVYVADAYALALLFLGFSGLFLLPKGRKGLVGRAGIMIAIGIAVPIVYIIIS